MYEITIESDKVASYGKLGASKLGKRIITLFCKRVGKLECGKGIEGNCPGVNTLLL